MARAKLPSPDEMTMFIASCMKRWGGSDDVIRALGAGDVTVLTRSGLPLDAALKMHYRAWQLVELSHDHGEPLPEGVIRELLRGVPSTAAADHLWKQRVVHVRPLGQHRYLPPRTSKTLLAAAARLGFIDAPEELRPRGEGEAEDVRWMLGNIPSQEIDRATRGPQGWNADALAYERQGVLITYGDDGVPIDVARAELSEMDPRTSDVWRLLVAKTLVRISGEIGRG